MKVTIDGVDYVPIVDLLTNGPGAAALARAVFSLYWGEIEDGVDVPTECAHVRVKVNDDLDDSWPTIADFVAQILKDTRGAVPADIEPQPGAVECLEWYDESTNQWRRQQCGTRAEFGRTLDALDADGCDTGAGLWRIATYKLSGVDVVERGR